MSIEIMKGRYLFSIEEILNDLKKCIENKIPFSLIRFGDGGLKFIESVTRGNHNQLSEISLKEGFPIELSGDILEWWGWAARTANYIDTPEIYFTEYFWPRLRGPKKPMHKQTIMKLKLWYEIYNDAEFDNKNYCNPEINFLSVLRISKNKMNLIDLLKGKRVCCIGTNKKIIDILQELECASECIEIPSQWQNQYEKSFNTVIKEISEKANYYDMWLVSAGELGRIYSGVIKEYGGRSFDLGFVYDYWLKKDIPVRLKEFIGKNPDNQYEFILKRKAKKFQRYL